MNNADEKGESCQERLESLSVDCIVSKLASAGSEVVTSEANAGKRAAVLVPLLHIDGEWNILFTRRSEWVNDHKGQVSFPGGAIEDDDPDERSAAVREAGEEIGLPADCIQILGQLEVYRTATGFMVYPVIANIIWPFDIRLNPTEVSRVFTIPIRWLCQRENFELRSWHSPFGWRENVIFYKPFDGEQLWGISARITVTLLQTMGLLLLDR
ncbi:MAG: CoA pyrophosphatase [Bellilinea sp.]|jgi:8-oxo-dGTP pyrophosphatase MutT (NUDIX family)